MFYNNFIFGLVFKIIIDCKILFGRDKMRLLVKITRTVVLCQIASWNLKGKNENLMGGCLPEYPKTFQQELVDHYRWVILSHWKLCQAFQHSSACGVHHQWTRMSLSGCLYQQFLRKSILNFSLIIKIQKIRSIIKTYLHYGFFATDF